MVVREAEKAEGEMDLMFRKDIIRMEDLETTVYLLLDLWLFVAG